MGKSLNGKELGRGITHRKDGIYQSRFVKRFGKKQTIYASTLNEVRQKLRNAQYEDEKAHNVVTKDITLDEWYEVFSPRSFRHTFATRAIENGMQPKTLQKILGHASLQMTMDLYCHVTDDTIFDAVKLMEQAV